MTRFATNEPDPAIYGDTREDIEAERIRQEAWDIFVASLRDQMAADSSRGWSDLPACPLLYYLARTYRWNDRERDGLSVVQADMLSFAERYGWPDTLRAIAQAMQADLDLQREALDRR
jgi:hypothetical protein